MDDRGRACAVLLHLRAAASGAARAKAVPEKLDASFARMRGAAQEPVQHARQIVRAVSPQHDSLASLIERFGSYTDEMLRAAGAARAVDLPDVQRIPPISWAWRRGTACSRR